MSVLGRDGNADHVGACADRRGITAKVRTDGERPGQCRKRDAERCLQTFDDRHHCSGKGDVIHKTAADGGDPQDDRDGQIDITA